MTSEFSSCLQPDILFEKGLDFLEQGSDALAINTFEEIDRRFGNWDEASLSGTVANALLMKAFLLDEEEQAKVLQAITQRFGSHSEADLASPVTWALWSLGGIAEEQGRGEEAVAIYREVLQRCGNRKEPSFPELKELVQRDIQRLTHDNSTLNFSR